jgi:hypothetical protein
MLRSFAVLAILAGFSSMVAAGPFGVFGRRGGGNYQASGSGQGGGGFATAQDAALHMARIGRIGHFGGNSGYEGVGAGMSPQAAEMNCCFRNRWQPREVGLAQGANGTWFACCRY